MNKSVLGWVLFCGALVFIAQFVPIFALAYDFEARTHALTGNLITTLMPILSTLALVYAVILALSGDASAKSRIITVVISSMVGFLAPHFIEWLKGAAGQ